MFRRTKHVASIFVLLLVVGCTNVTEPDQEVVEYKNASSEMYSKIDIENEPFVMIMADYIFDTSNLGSIFEFSTEVVSGGFFGIKSTYVNNIDIIHTIYDFKISEDHKSSRYDAGQIIEVAIPGGVMAYGEYEKQLESLGVGEIAHQQKSESFIREKYSKEETEEIIAAQNETKHEDDLVAQNYQTNPLSERSIKNGKTDFLLFLTEGEKEGILETSAMNNGYKVIDEDSQKVVSIGYEEEITTKFSLLELEKISGN